MAHMRVSRFRKTPQTNLAIMHRDMQAGMGKRGTFRGGSGNPNVRHTRRVPESGGAAHLRRAAPLIAGLAVAGAAACAAEKSPKEKKIELIKNSGKAIVTGPDGSKKVQEVELPGKVREELMSGYIGAGACIVELALLVSMMAVAVRTWRKMDGEPGKGMKSAL